MTITLHHLNNSRSERILWLLEELGVPYQIQTHIREPSLRAPDSLRAINKLGKSPVIQDGATVLAESGAIVEYLIVKYGNGRFVISPANEKRWVENLYWTQAAEGSMMPLLQNQLVYTIVPQRVSFLVRPLVSKICNGLISATVTPSLNNLVAQLEEHLRTNLPDSWIAGGDSAGNPTSADFMFSYVLEALMKRHEFGTAAGAGDAINAVLKKMQGRPAYIAGVEKAKLSESEARAAAKL